VVIASHFWMFLQQFSEGGIRDATTFLTDSENLPKNIMALMMAAGDLFKYSKNLIINIFLVI
jgi:hypothetical protein